MKKFVKKLIALTLLTTMTISSLTIHANAIQAAGYINSGSRSFWSSWEQDKTVEYGSLNGKLIAKYNFWFGTDTAQVYSVFAHDGGVTNCNKSKWESYKKSVTGYTTLSHPELWNFSKPVTYSILIYQ